MKNIANIKVVFDSEYFLELMKEKGYKQQDLANITGNHQSSISNFVSNKKLPMSDTLYKIAMALDVPMEDLLKEV